MPIPGYVEGRPIIPVAEAPVVDYKISYATSYTALVTAVKTDIAAGWQPLGGVMGVTSAIWGQAMVKYAL